MKFKRIVIKVGTSTLTNGTLRLNRQRILHVVEQVAALQQAGHEMIVVSSGAQAAGRERLNFPDLSRSMPAKQMLSAIGQSRLMQIYNDLFDIFDLAVGQVLLTRDDLGGRGRYLNARDTMLTLISHRIIPIVNENDTVVTEEIRVGDNDNLSAAVASAIDADLLLMLTDQEGLFTADPRSNPQAQLISTVNQIDESILALAGGAGTQSGTGGMITKLQAARTATQSGVTAIIASGQIPNIMLRIVQDDESLGTLFRPVVSRLEGRKRWLLTGKIDGAVRIDAGAVRALSASDGASLLPVGIVDVRGEFKRGATVSVYDPDEREIAHGVSAYSSDELRRIRGQKSSRISEILGYSYGDAAIHRDDMVMIS